MQACLERIDRDCESVSAKSLDTGFTREEQFAVCRKQIHGLNRQIRSRFVIGRNIGSDVLVADPRGNSMSAWKSFPAPIPKVHTRQF